MRTTLLAFIAALTLGLSTLSATAATPQQALTPQAPHYDWING